LTAISRAEISTKRKKSAVLSIASSTAFAGPADSQIATALAVRELIFVVIFNLSFISQPLLLVYTRLGPNNFPGRTESSSSRSLGRIAKSVMNSAITQNITNNDSWLMSFSIMTIHVRRRMRDALMPVPGSFS
jgi:hypothetical protein